MRLVRALVRPVANCVEIVAGVRKFCYLQTLPKRQRSQFRETALSTHKYLSPPLLSRPQKQQDGFDTTAARPQRKGSGPAERRRKATHIKGVSGLSNAPASVFQIAGGQSHAAAKAAEHRQLRAKSEWALLDTLEVCMFNDEFDKRAKYKKDMQGVQILQRLATQKRSKGDQERARQLHSWFLGLLPTSQQILLATMHSIA